MSVSTVAPLPGKCLTDPPWENVEKITRVELES
jgi:hypothetical protein